MAAHVSQAKKDAVAQLVKLIKEYPIVGTVNMANLPAPQLQTMRSKLREDVQIVMTKQRLIKIALDKCKADKPGLEGLAEKMMGMPALIFTKNNPFTLNKTLQKNKSSAPAKAGQIAPNDIVVPAGPTPFAPGPVIGELGAVGIKTGVENGKVAIKEDTKVASTGDEISQPLAEILTRLSIEPMEVGLDLTAAYEDGTIYTKDILNIDEQQFIDDISTAARWSFNLAMEAAIPTSQTTELLVTKAFGDAMAIGREQKIMEPELMEEFVSEAERSMLSVKAAGNISDEAPKAEEKKEEPAKESESSEEKKVDAKPEGEAQEAKSEEKPAEKEKKDDAAKAAQ